MIGYVFWVGECGAFLLCFQIEQNNFRAGLGVGNSREATEKQSQNFHRCVEQTMKMAKKIQKVKCVYLRANTIFKRGIQFSKRKRKTIF